MIKSTDFYSAYLSNHFQIKAGILTHFLNLDKSGIDKIISQTNLSVNDIEFIKTVKIDLVQTFYQSVETLFGFMHSLEKVEAQLKIPDYLVKLKVRDLHEYIKKFEDFNFCLNHLKSPVQGVNRSINRGQYLFYIALSCINNLPDEYLNRIVSETNIKGIAKILNSLAQEFNQEAHNSIKHGLRCLLISKFNMSIDIPEDLESTIEVPNELKLNGNDDILLYYSKEKDKKSATVVLVSINVKKMIYLGNKLTKLLFNMLHQRDVILNYSRADKLSVHTFDENNENEFSIDANFKSIRIGEPE